MVIIRITPILFGGKFENSRSHARIAVLRKSSESSTMMIRFKAAPN